MRQRLQAFLLVLSVVGPAVAFLGSPTFFAHKQLGRPPSSKRERRQQCCRGCGQPRMDLLGIVGGAGTDHVLSAATAWDLYQGEMEWHFLSCLIAPTWRKGLRLRLSVGRECPLTDAELPGSRVTHMGNVCVPIDSQLEHADMP